jgi:hypothetical protein
MEGRQDFGEFRELTDEQELIPTDFIRVHSRLRFIGFLEHRGGG